MTDDFVTRVRHEYRVLINVTKGNRKDLQREHGKALLVGDSLMLPLEQVMQNGDTSHAKPTPAILDSYRKIAAEFGGTLEYRYLETTTSDWVSNV